MRLTTIWTIPAMTLRERIARTADLAAQRIAKRLPGRIRYWTFVQVGGRAIPENAIVPDIRFVDVLAGAEGGPC